MKPLNGSRSNFDPLHTIVLGPDEYSAPGRIESFATLPCTDPTRTLASNHEDPSSPNADGSDDVPGLTHSPTPSLTKSDDENIFVDVQSLRPLLGWTTIKKINYQTNMVDDQVVGISATSVRVNNMTVQIFSGMEEMKAVVWQTFRPCGKIGSLDTTVIIWISITVFREHEDMYLHTVQVDFEDADSATRALSLYRIYFHNLFWRTLRISRRAYNQSNWRLVRKSELAILQQKLLDSESRKSKFALPARLQVEYSKLFDTDYTLGLGAERYEDIREFSELSEEHTPPLLTLEDTSYHADPGTTAKSSSDWSLRSASPVVVSPDAVVLASTRSAIETLKKADVSRRERKEKKQMQEGVHPDLVGLVGHAWSSGEQAVEEAEVEVEVKVQVGREKNGASEDWIDLLGPV
ncbi:uncharacterized protein I303_106839 [Kwoniella dejecticola CBS 10117]|uniref:Uncharacterized protein n=1 Tax=Kwoniella dejecticola CBS 10117 TaxID=1296121 RepID=A0AAJ8KUR9_9TREE